MHTYVCLAGVATDLREQKVDAERCVFVLKMGFDVVNRLLEDFGRLVQTTDDADATLCISYKSSLLSASLFVDITMKLHSGHTALVTAAASFGPAATFMPVRMGPKLFSSAPRC